MRLDMILAISTRRSILCAEPLIKPMINAHFVFSAQDIDAAGIAVSAPLPVEWLNAQFDEARAHVDKAGSMKGRLSRSGNDIVVRCKLAFHATIPCARCLEPAEVDVDSPLTLLLRAVAKSRSPQASRIDRVAVAKRSEGRTPRNVGPDEYEFSAEEAEIDTYDGENVVLDPFIRETILLEMPNFPLCSEDCPGIRPSDFPRRESAMNVDPRLSPLEALRRKFGAKSGPAVPERKTRPVLSVNKTSIKKKAKVASKKRWSAR